MVIFPFCIVSFVFRPIVLETTQPHRGKLVEICNDWNREKLWPKAYVTVDDEGMVRVHAETNTDLEHGVGDRQLAQLTDCGIATALQLFNRLDEEFPDTRFS